MRMDLFGGAGGALLAPYTLLTGELNWSMSLKKILEKKKCMFSPQGLKEN